MADAKDNNPRLGAPQVTEMAEAEANGRACRAGQPDSSATQGNGSGHFRQVEAASLDVTDRQLRAFRHRGSVARQGATSATAASRPGFLPGR